MVYWLIGQPGSGKTTLGKKLQEILKTKKRNSKRDVFLIDGDDFRSIYQNSDYTEQGRRINIKNAQALVEYLHLNGYDVVVSLVTPYKDLREEFKNKLDGSIVEIYLHTTQKRERDHYHVTNFETPEVNFISLDTTIDSIETSFSKLINYLYKLEYIKQKIKT